MTRVFYVVRDSLLLVTTVNTSNTQLYGSGDSVVGIATSYGLDDRGVGVRVPVGSRIFSSPIVQPGSEVWVPEALSPGIKQPGREVDHSNSN
jgi:hypothetical protein